MNNNTTSETIRKMKQKEYYQKNKEKIKAQAYRWYHANREEAQVRNRDMKRQERIDAPWITDYNNARQGGKRNDALSPLMDRSVALEIYKKCREMGFDQYKVALKVSYKDGGKFHHDNLHIVER